MSDFQDAWMHPEGGYETAPPLTVKDPNMVPVAHGRDAQADSRTQSDVDGGGANISGDGDHDDVGMTAGGYLLDLDVTSLGTEKRRMGWDPLATPNGGDMGGVPRPANTSGTRGADDIKPEGIPHDGSMP